MFIARQCRQLLFPSGCINEVKKLELGKKNRLAKNKQSIGREMEKITV